MQLTALLIAAFSAISAVAAQEGTEPTTVIDPSQVVLESVTYNGSGCPPGTAGKLLLHKSLNRPLFQLVSNTVSYGLPPQNPEPSIDPSTPLSLKFTAFTATSGPTVSLAERRKNCQIAMTLTAPSGYQFAPDVLTTTGSVKLGPGTSGVLTTTYGFQGLINTARSETGFRGPFQNSFNVDSNFPVEAGSVWSACGGKSTLNVNVAASLTGRGSGSVNVESLKGTGVYGLKWRQC
ncbi:hypothetical protein HDV05_000436 [Chytridiales sp. JEL 0842]|nr:hypothetical protein HDV05_000436 [Chytridiales sp. JEL 0842]